MSYLLTQWPFQGLLVFIGLAGFVFTLWGIFTDGLSRGERYVPVGIGLFVVGVTVWGFLWGQTHVAVPTNRFVLVVDRGTGQPILPLRGPGITSIPLWRSAQYGFPGQRDYQWCPTFTPSSKNGAGLTVIVCFTVDASRIDWLAQFQSFNGGEDAITQGWQNATQTMVAQAFGQFDPRDLTNRRAEVEMAVFQTTLEWFKTHGITVTMVGLKNWDFTNPEVSKAYDEAQLAQTKVDVANAEMAAAQVEQQTALIRAETQVKVAKTLALGQREACNTAGMVSETACLNYLQLIWFSQGVDNPNVVIITGGGDAAPVIALPNNPPEAAPTSTP